MDNSIKPRPYYAARKYGATAASLSFEDLRELLFSAYQHYDHSGYFVEAFGFECVDSGFDPGSVGSNVAAYAKLALERPNLWPLDTQHGHYDEDDTFTMIEFLYDHISKPRSKSMHGWNNCGYHYSDFDRDEGRAEFRERINVPLKRYGEGWELTESGELLSLPPRGMSTLVGAPLTGADASTAQKVADATVKFRRHGSSIADRKDAVRDLADVLEWLRPQIKTALLKEDENELFDLANNFGIRHMNQRQKLQYDQAVWLSWMFYHYLNTIHAFLHITRRQAAKES
ncbi:MAG: hypothetical protein P0Y56_12195 [Candidatus Andeanibacterium colombiense]|uniref:Uncharacterized protein n=1 Tax=Candidatus Andeanibacterium colombiense TaxID=3121345 RepID=A0AAJ5X4A6_9SPHN|nr:MAG: hypothetical protein P0Y56_12195 [Sphingomonadaceae bacterium]